MLAISYQYLDTQIFYVLIYLTFNIKNFADMNALVAQLVEQLICNQ